ncbi:MAG: hypothetical protein A3E25_15470 [Burkholderiales bacterium RIFCSPHIGHO2_12_FULL_69_20]|nr:MAG: hypothetical protein A3E25_15470 [Burkholderiales bacterium RIFCSPHIGHO2_12_FULL_69_20]
MGAFPATIAAMHRLRRLGRPPPWLLATTAAAALALLTLGGHAVWHMARADLPRLLAAAR